MLTQSVQNHVQSTPYSNGSKSLGMSPSKSLGEAVRPKPEDVKGGCAAWIEQWQSIHDQIMAGQHPLNPQQEAQFKDMWNYAYTTAFGAAQQQGAGWGDLPGNGQEQDPPQLPAGAKLGPNGNIVFAQEKAEADFQPSDKPIDVLSDEFTLNFPEKIQGGITVEKTMDTRLNPATPVYKVTVTDQNSVPKVTTYFVNSEAKLNINTVGGKGVDLKEQQTFDSVVTVGTYKVASKKGDDKSNPPASKDGKVNDTTGETEYVCQGSEKIDFFPQDLAEDGKARTSKIWANANIVVPGGCHAEVQVAKDSNGKVTETTITIKDKDGKVTDVYKVEKGFTVEIQANKEYVKFGTAAEGADKPEGFDNVTLSGTQSEEPTTSTSSVDEVITSMEEATGKSDLQLLKALKGAGYDDYFISSSDEDVKKGMEKFKADIKSGKFPGDLSLPKNQSWADSLKYGGLGEGMFKFFNFLKVMDPKLDSLLADSHKSKADMKAFLNKLSGYVEIFEKPNGGNVSVTATGDDKNNKGAVSIDGVDIFTLSTSTS